MGQLAGASAALEDRFNVGDADLIVGVLDASSVVALGRVKIHTGDDRGAREVAEIAKAMLTATAPGVRHQAVWFGSC